MEFMQKKSDDETYDYLYQKIPNSISSKELYCEKDLGVNLIKLIKLKKTFLFFKL